MKLLVFEGNVDLYLSMLHATWDANERDALLRLLVSEEDKMGLTREGLENGERRVADGKERLHRLRTVVAQLPPERQAASVSVPLLETIEKTQELLEAHLEKLRERFEQSKL